MFKVLLDKDFVNELKQDAEDAIIKERRKYEDIILFILEFAKQNKALISNIDLLLDKHDYWNIVQVLTLNVDEMAKNLVSKLCKQFDQLFLLKIFEADHEYYIEYNLRRICVLNAIKPYKTFTLFDFISPIKYIINDSISIYLLPYLVEVIHMYNNLYDPAAAGSWEETLSDIKKIETFVDKEIEELLTMPKEDILLKLSTSGGNAKAAASVDKLIKAKCKCKNIRKAKLFDIKRLVMDFLKDSEYIFCNEYDTFMIYSDKDDKRSDLYSTTIRVISKDINADFALLVNYLSKFMEYGISYRKKVLYLPKEQRLEKYNFYIEIPYVKNIKQKRFLTVFNNLSYELVNFYEKDGFKFADPIIQLRFAYLSIWSSIIMQKTHGLHYEEFIELIKNKKHQIRELRSKVDIYELKKNYIGTYISLDISKKMSMTNTNTKSNFYCHDF